MARVFSPVGSSIRKNFFFLPGSQQGAVDLGAKIVVSFSQAKSGAQYVRTFGNFMKSNSADAPRVWLKEFANMTKDEIVRKYDATRSPRNKKKTNVFRSKITAGEVSFDNLGNFAVQVGAKIPSFWPILEYGVGPHQREQTFQVVGRFPRSSRFNEAMKAGRSVDSRKRRDSAVRKNQLIATRNRLKGEKEGKHQRTISPGIPGGVKLIPRTKAELGRIKRKITIVFDHPGFPAGEFIRAGQIFIITKGDEFVRTHFIRTLSAILTKSNAETKAR